VTDAIAWLIDAGGTPDEVARDVYAVTAATYGLKA
jgi:hypothetical protein